jgi:hypothetical protein
LEAFFYCIKIGYKEFLIDKDKKLKDKIRRELNQYQWNKWTFMIAALTLILGLLTSLMSR